MFRISVTPLVKKRGIIYTNSKKGASLTLFEIRKSWRPSAYHTPPKFPKTFGPVEADPVPPTRFFDQLSCIGDEFVLCFVLETTAGLVLIDCLYPYPKYVEMIEDGLRTLALSPENIQAILVTHAHFDHFGQADYFREKYGAKIYMSKTDYDFARSLTECARGLMPLPYEVWDFIGEGDVLTFGETVIHVVETPGHSPGGLSFLFPVTDEGVPHMACIWGGTGVPRMPEEQQTYLASAKHFSEVCERLGADVEISNHPVVDNGLIRLALCREITRGVANPFVIGRDSCKKYTEMFYDMCKERMEHPEKGRPHDR